MIYPLNWPQHLQDLSRRLLDSFRDGGGLGPLSRPSRSPTLAPAPAPLAADPAIAAVYQNHQELSWVGPVGA